MSSTCKDERSVQPYGICRVRSRGRTEDEEFRGKVRNEAANSSYICHCLPLRPYDVHVLLKKNLQEAYSSIRKKKKKKR